MNLPAGVDRRMLGMPAALLLACAYLFSTGWGLWSQSIENPDEPRYACAAREMALGRSDWMVPRFNGEPRLVKPVLLYWLMAASAKLTAPLGVGMVTAFRLPALFFGLLAVLSVFGLGRRLWNGRVGVLAGLLLTTTFYFHTTAREIVIDPLVAGALAWSWYGFVVVLQKLKENPEKTPYLPLLGFYVGLGVACMAKGPTPVGVFAAVPMGVFLVWNRKAIVPEGKGLGWLALRSGVLWGVPLALGLGFAWFAMLYGTEYRDQIKNFFVEQNFARGVGALDHNEGLKRYPFVYYLLDCPQKFMPWTLLAVPAVYLWTRPREQGATPETSLGSARFFVCAILIPFVCIGLAGSKRSLYALPLYPMLALGGAVVLGRVLSEARAALAVKLLLVLALAAAGAEAIGRPMLEERKRADLPFYETLRETAGGRPLLWIGTSANAAVWHLDRPVKRLVAPREQLGDAFFGAPGALLAVREKDFEAIEGLKPAVRVLREMEYDRGRYYLVEADPEHPPEEGRFKRGGQGPNLDENE